MGYDYKKSLIFALFAGAAIGGFMLGPYFNEHHDRFFSASVSSHQTSVTSPGQGLNNQYTPIGFTQLAGSQHNNANDPYIRRSDSGDFLVAYIAQRENDWDTASSYMERLIQHNPDIAELRNSAVFLTLGSGQLDKAANLAQDVLDRHAQNGDDAFYDDEMAVLVLTLKAVKDGDFAKAHDLLSPVDDGQHIRILKPLLMAWIKAGMGKNAVNDLVENPLYFLDAVKISSFLGDKKETKSLLNRALKQNGIAGYDMERIGDLYAQQDLLDQASILYESAIKTGSRNEFRITTKLAAIKNKLAIDPDSYIAHPPENATNGMAESIFDVSKILFRQGASGISRLYTAMTMGITPLHTDARLLMAHILADEGRAREALVQYQSIPQDHNDYLPAQRRAAELLNESGQHDQAIDILADLERDFNDIQSRIQIGDIYRDQMNYKRALESYNIAFRKMDKNDKDIWSLYYLRGMTHERLKNYQSSEKDLRSALELQPDNPYILNYLGYSMADQGRQLDESLTLIERAVELQPDDGYIIDSLGWVLYRLGQYERATPYLERAVELLPYDSTINDHLGDVYWQTGRHVEARFQWSRALNQLDEDQDDYAAQNRTLEEKMASGLSADQSQIKAAQK